MRKSTGTMIMVGVWILVGMTITSASMICGLLRQLIALQ